MKQLMTSNITLKGIDRGIIYHYTNHDTFKKIIRSQYFLMSNYPDLKGDSEELIWAFDTYHAITKHLFPEFLDNGKVLPKEFYVLSTCIRENNEHLWIEYAENFTGVVIGIQANALFKLYNRQNSQIHMSPMFYDTKRFIDLCKQSVLGLKPIIMRAPINFPENINEYPSEMRNSMILDMIPEYREFTNNNLRNEVLGDITLQKNEKYKKEEEVRILHSTYYRLNEPLEIKNINGKNKAVLPLVIENNHLISEIIVTPHCKMTVGEIKRHLRQYKIQTDVRVIEYPK